jgi:hypothetical protein
MTLDDIKALLAGRLGQRTDIDTMIYSEIRQAQRVLETTPPYPWFLVTNLVEEYGLTQNPLPDDFIEFVEDFIFIRKATLDTVDYVRPFKVYGGQLEHVVDTSFGRPKNFFLRGDLITFYPYPDVSYTFHLQFMGKDATLDGPTSENLWSNKASDLLVAEAGWHVARNIRDNEAATMFGQDRAEARRRIAQETTSRLESMRRAVIGSGEDAMLGQMTWEQGHQ